MPLPMRRLAHLLNAGLAVLLVVESLWAFPILPARIPRHFGIGGAVDAYWAATIGHWMLLLGITLTAVGLVLFVVVQGSTYRLAASKSSTLFAVHGQVQ